MQTIRPPASEIAQCRIALAQCRVWLCQALLWLAQCLGEGAAGRALRDHLRADARRCARGVRALLYILALGQLVDPPSITRPHHVGPNRRRGSWLRHLTRCVTLRGRSLEAHLARLRDVIDDVDACVARIAKGMMRWMRRLPPLVRASARARESVAPVPPASAGPVLETGPPS